MGCDQSTTAAEPSSASRRRKESRSHASPNKADGEDREYSSPISRMRGGGTNHTPLRFHSPLHPRPHAAGANGYGVAKTEAFPRSPTAQSAAAKTPVVKAPFFTPPDWSGPAAPSVSAQRLVYRHRPNILSALGAMMMAEAGDEKQGSSGRKKTPKVGVGISSSCLGSCAIAEKESDSSSVRHYKKKHMDKNYADDVHDHHCGDREDDCGTSLSYRPKVITVSSHPDPTPLPLDSLLRAERGALLHIFTESPQFQPFNRNFILNQVFLKLKMRRVADKILRRRPENNGHHNEKVLPASSSDVLVEDVEEDEVQVLPSHHKKLITIDHRPGEDNDGNLAKADEMTQRHASVFISSYHVSDQCFESFLDRHLEEHKNNTSSSKSQSELGMSPPPHRSDNCARQICKTANQKQKKNLLELLYESSQSHNDILQQLASQQTPPVTPGVGGSYATTATTTPTTTTSAEKRKEGADPLASFASASILHDCTATGSCLIAQRMEHCTRLFYGSPRSELYRCHYPSNDLLTDVSTSAQPQNSAAGLHPPPYLQQVLMEGDGNCQFRALAHQLFLSLIFGRSDNTVAGLVLPTNSAMQRLSVKKGGGSVERAREIDRLLDVTVPEEHHAAVRETVVTYMREHSDDYSFYFEDGQAWEAYLRQMARRGTWGDELTLKAACNCFNVVLHVLTTEASHYYLQYKPDSFFALQKQEQQPCQAISGKSSSLCSSGNISGHNGDACSNQTALLLRKYSHLYLAYISPIHYNSIRFK